MPAAVIDPWEVVRRKACTGPDPQDAGDDAADDTTADGYDGETNDTSEEPALPCFNS